jgi:hypothetical protein
MRGGAGGLDRLVSLALMLLWLLPGSRSGLAAAEATAAALQPASTAALVAGLIESAANGSITAAGQLIELGLPAQTGVVDGRSRRIAGWMEVREAVGELSAQQVYGVALAQWALTNPMVLRGLWRPTLQRARAFSLAHGAAQPALLLEQAFLLHEAEPRQPERARTLFLEALLLLPQPGERPPPAPGAILLAAEIADACAYRERGALLAQAQAVAAASGDPYWLAQARWLLAQVAVHRRAAAADDAPPGDPGAAIASCREAVAALSGAGDGWSLGASCQALAGLLAESALHAPASTPASTAAAGAADNALASAKQAYEQAAASFAVVHASGAQGQALIAEAQLWTPPLPESDWSRAESCWSAGAAALDAAGDGEGAADAIAQAAEAAANGDPLLATEEARTLLREAVGRYRSLRLDVRAERLLAWFTPRAQQR